jgi:hypothetical protein
MHSGEFGEFEQKENSVKTSRTHHQIYSCETRTSTRDPNSSKKSSTAIKTKLKHSFLNFPLGGAASISRYPTYMKMSLVAILSHKSQSWHATTHSNKPKQTVQENKTAYPRKSVFHLFKVTVSMNVTRVAGTEEWESKAPEVRTRRKTNLNRTKQLETDDRVRAKKQLTGIPTWIQMVISYQQTCIPKFDQKNGERHDYKWNIHPKHLMSCI